MRTSSGNLGQPGLDHGLYVRQSDGKDGKDVCEPRWKWASLVGTGGATETFLRHTSVYTFEV